MEDRGYARMPPESQHEGVSQRNQKLFVGVAVRQNAYKSYFAQISNYIQPNFLLNSQAVQKVVAADL